jgi:AcrR family transcriptional regulator
MTYNSRHKRVQELFGLPDPPKAGRERLVHAAVDLFYNHGFQAVGLDRILAEAGVTKTTFYKHFESREDLIVAAIKRRDEWESQAWAAAVQRLGGPDPKAQLLAFFDVMDIWFNDPDFRGCQFLNAAAEFPDPRDPVHIAAADHKRATRNYFRDLAVAAGIVEAETFADQYTALVEGTLVLRQAHGRNDAARVIKPAVESLLGDALDKSPRQVVGQGLP